MKRLVELCIQFDKAQAEWKTQLQVEASKADPKQEKVITNYFKVHCLIEVYF
jgi:hypothetical protein